MGEWMALPESERILMGRIGRGVQIRYGDECYLDLVVQYDENDTANTWEITHLIECDGTVFIGAPLKLLQMLT